MAKDFQDWDAGLHKKDKNSLKHYGIPGMRKGVRREWLEEEHKNESSSNKQTADDIRKKYGVVKADPSIAKRNEEANPWRKNPGMGTLKNPSQLRTPGAPIVKKGFLQMVKEYPEMAEKVAKNIDNKNDKKNKKKVTPQDIIDRNRSKLINLKRFK